MKKIIFLMLFVLFAKNVEAQNTDLYDYVMNVVKPTHLSGSNTFRLGWMGHPNTLDTDNQPILVIDDTRRLVVGGTITKFEDLNSYTRADVYAIYVWKNRDINGLGYGTKGKNRGVIFVYTKAYTFPNPQKPNIPRYLAGNGNSPNRIVVFEAPLPPPLPPIGNEKTKGGK